MGKNEIGKIYEFLTEFNCSKCIYIYFLPNNYKYVSELTFNEFIIKHINHIEYVKKLNKKKFKKEFKKWKKEKNTLYYYKII